ncbi:MAG TPA: lipoyl(octanoyl) transferase LipB [Candidatus Sumerlaeota bacterium]|nr:lipoyl(octanoyl) transferase LipB [Candidatus Sumerlaeota bacterium]HPS01486.1 lipoyl(octanoyl) transferase LipB [Candidatus Sumerlaeota bacterium]
MTLHPELLCFDLGKASYSHALRLQHALVSRFLEQTGTQQAALVLVEHDPPVITLGRRARESHILASPQFLRTRGVELIESARGGDVTYHGPGQIVAYPILRLDPKRRPLHAHVSNLEEAVIRVARSYGIEAERAAGRTGVWTSLGKLAAIGVAVHHWVAYHGIAMNVASDLSGFDLIVPCGLRDHTVTSLERLVGAPIDFKEAKERLRSCLGEAFGFDAVVDASPGEWTEVLEEAARTEGLR